MKLNALLEHVETLERVGAGDPEVLAIAYDSRSVKPGGLFVATPGANVDGSEFITQAVSNGAVAVVSEHALDLGAGVVHARVPSARRALAELASAFHGDPSKRLTLIGVTGTNGKTTTAHMIRDILRDHGGTPGLLGTVAYEFGDRVLPASRTTPEAPDLHSMFQRMTEAGCDSAVMEVSSHALALDRVLGIDFNVGVFTNLTRDHLDYHRDMETYYDVKTRLFSQLNKQPDRTAVINIDDPWGRKMVDEGRIEANLVTYGFHERAMVRAHAAEITVKGASFNVSTPWGDGAARLKLLGRFNVHNALAALAVGGALGIELDAVLQSLARVESIPGRLELTPTRKNRKVFVDYAHTDDALRNVLVTLREICKGRLIVVFGCGGNRDRGKRCEMGAVAAELADYSVVTSDNPRDEEPGAIAGDILEGFGGQDQFEVVLDRHDAIKKAIKMIKRDDVLLIAGKGHEAYQEINGAVVPFDDRQVVKEILG